jgi:hypothetical protein
MQQQHSSTSAGSAAAADAEQLSWCEDPAASAQYAPVQLVDLVKPGPSGTVASTAAVATAAHAALVAAAPDVAPAGLLAAVSAGKVTSKKCISTIMQVMHRTLLAILMPGHANIMHSMMYVAPCAWVGLQMYIEADPSVIDQFHNE